MQAHRFLLSDHEGSISHYCPRGAVPIKLYVARVQQMFSINRSFKLASLLSMTILVTASALALENSAVIEEGKLVSFTYTLSVENEVLEDNSDKEPLTYIQGGDQILPALEAELLGLSAGAEKVVNLTAANAYGERSAERIQEVPLEQIPESARVVGTLLQSPSIMPWADRFSWGRRVSKNPCCSRV